MSKGWKKEPARHSLAAKGVKTKIQIKVPRGAGSDSYFSTNVLRDTARSVVTDKTIEKVLHQKKIGEEGDKDLYELEVVARDRVHPKGYSVPIKKVKLQEGDPDVETLYRRRASVGEEIVKKFEDPNNYYDSVKCLIKANGELMHDLQEFQWEPDMNTARTIIYDLRDIGRDSKFLSEELVDMKNSFLPEETIEKYERFLTSNQETLFKHKDFVESYIKLSAEEFCKKFASQKRGLKNADKQKDIGMAEFVMGYIKAAEKDLQKSKTR